MSVLYVIALPIGNALDLTPRAKDLLETLPLIAAEDTRRFLNSCKHYQIVPKAHLISYHEHNEKEKTSHLIEQIQNGLSIGLVCDAGTPGINDPGYHVIRECHHQNIPVRPVPGACAFMTLAMVSGLPLQPLIYEGFLPRKESLLHQTFEVWSKKQGCYAFYEAPTRILSSLTILAKLFPDLELVLGRELTKTFEQIVFGSTLSILNLLKDGKIISKGEFVGLLSIPESKAQNDSRLELHLEDLEFLAGQGVSSRTLLEFSKKKGFRRAQVYEPIVNYLDERTKDI